MNLRQQILQDISFDLSSIGDTAFRMVIPITGRSKIYAVHIVQTDGTKDGFTFQLVSQKAALGGAVNWPRAVAAATATELSAPATSTLSPKIFNTIPVITVAGSADEGVYRDSNGAAHVNSDIDMRNRIDEIYGILTPTSPGAGKAWDLRIVYAEAES